MALPVAELDSGFFCKNKNCANCGKQNSKMCGIFLIITTDQTSFQSEICNHLNIRKFLQRRGPDHFHCEDFIYGPFVFHLESSVLHLRGPEGSGQQPYRSQNGSLLQWNGQMFRLMTDTDVSSEEKLSELPECSSDTEILAEMLNNASSKRIIDILSSIHGPWSMTFWDNKQKQLWVGRDLIGRRSLCWNTNKRDEFLIITSVCGHSRPSTDNSLGLPSLKFEEIPSDAIYRFDFAENSMINAWNERLSVYWPKSLTGFPKASNHHNDLKITRCLIPNQFNDDLPSANTDELLQKPLDQELFEIPEEICDKFAQVLQESVRIRCQNHQNKCRNCFNTLQQCEHCCVAVLFSGGLDSTVLALLAHQVIKPVTRPIDLLNVAFTENAPDRCTGLDSWHELMELAPERPWNFVKINVSSSELDIFRKNHVCFLLQPNATIMDDSIGCSLWWAAKGQGLKENPDNHPAESYRTSARIVLLGMGADEQLGGYSRHRQAFQSGGWSKLIQEIRLDIDRISCRNLGRDDRIISDHGVEARFPYLDEIVLNFLNSLPIWIKCNPYLPRGNGEKWLLRMVAKKLGLQQASQNWKRAIQFGSKITKYQPINSTGQDLIDNL